MKLVVVSHSRAANFPAPLDFATVLGKEPWQGVSDRLVCYTTAVCRLSIAGKEKIAHVNKEDISMDVRIDLYPDRATGAYTLDVIARPEGLASPADLPGQSADLVLDNTPPRAEVYSISFTRAMPSPGSLATLAQPGRVVLAYLYHPLDEAAMFAFDARITEEYTALYAARGVSNLGTFRAVGPDGPCVADVMVFETSSLAEAERLAEEDLPARIVAIDDECRALQDRERRRYILWLIPR